MAEIDKNNNSLPEESVDDILAGILNSDGTFNDDFNGLFAKYFVGAPQEIAVPDVDISDRTDEPLPSEKVSFDSGEYAYVREKTAEERIEEKIPESVRAVYSEASSDAQRPEFTSTGDVKYPTMGVGASEQRVVFDADWEETAKKEAARLERVRQDRLLRGDSAYARTFVAGGMYMPQQNQYINAPGANPSYIDPLSKDEDFENPAQNAQYYSSQKKSFFPEGFSVVQRNSVAASGKTERRRGGNEYRNRPGQDRDMSWLQVEEKSDKKKKKRADRKKEKTVSVIAPIEIPEENIPADMPSEENALPYAETTAEAYDVYMQAVGQLEEVTDEAAGLRTTVAEIVDKYNKRNEEDERRRREEEIRLEEQRREEELRERRREEELRILKKELSPELCEAIDSVEEDEFFDEYEDFSTEPVVREEKKKERSFGVVFNPEAFAGNDYLEKLPGEDVTDRDEKPAEKSEEEKENGNKSKKKPIFSNRRKDN